MQMLTKELGWLDGWSHHSVSPSEFLEQKSIWRKNMSCYMLQCFPNGLWINASGPTSKVFKLPILHTNHVFAGCSSGREGLWTPLPSRAWDCLETSRVLRVINFIQFSSRGWFQNVSNMFCFHPYLGKMNPFLTHIFQLGWIHQPVIWWAFFFPLMVTFSLRMGCAKSLPAIIDLHQGWRKEFSPVVRVRCIHVSRCIP